MFCTTEVPAPKGHLGRADPETILHDARCMIHRVVCPGHMIHGVGGLGFRRMMHRVGGLGFRRMMHRVGGLGLKRMMHRVWRLHVGCLNLWLM